VRVSETFSLQRILVCNGERKLDLDLLSKCLLIVAQSFALGSPARSSGIISRITKTAAATNLPRTVSLSCCSFSTLAESQ
jgi:hypothetical protein